VKGVTIAVITRPKYVSLIDQLSVISYQLSASEGKRQKKESGNPPK
jgi:hypothetical protein